VPLNTKKDIIPSRVEGPKDTDLNDLTRQILSVEYGQQCELEDDQKWLV
jgi:hypothetical protein